MTLPDTLMVDVTTEDIERGVPRSCTYCPIARAVDRALGFDSSIVDRRHVVVRNGVYRTSDDAQSFISAFDAGRPVQPATFVFRRCG